MTKWIVFDETSKNALGASASVEVRSDSNSDVFALACTQARGSVVILPGAESNSSLLARISKPSAGTPTYEPAGLLGLSDVLAPQDPSPQHRKWWQKLIE